MTHDEVPAELVEKAKREIYDRLPAGGASVWLLADQMARHALAAVVPEIQAQALNGVTEVFEIVDRHTNRRLEERVYLSSNEALNHVSTWDPIDQRIARVQSVARVAATTEGPTT